MMTPTEVFRHEVMSWSHFLDMWFFRYNHRLLRLWVFALDTHVARSALRTTGPSRSRTSLRPRVEVTTVSSNTWTIPQNYSLHFSKMWRGWCTLERSSKGSSRSLFKTRQWKKGVSNHASVFFLTLRTLVWTRAAAGATCSTSERRTSSHALKIFVWLTQMCKDCHSMCKDCQRPPLHKSLGGFGLGFGLGVGWFSPHKLSQSRFLLRRGGQWPSLLSSI